MTTEQLKKLRQYFYSLSNQNQVFVEHNKLNIDETPVIVLREEIDRIKKDFPDLLPPFDSGKFFSHASSSYRYYKTAGIRSYIATALSRLHVSLESTEETPVTQLREFVFIKNLDLRRVIERDYMELQRAFISKCFKSTIILAGGAIEAILTDLLLQNESRAKASSKAPKKIDITS
jgi:hypothetical protein